MREFEGSVLQTIVWRGRRGSWGKSEVVWSNQRFGHPPLDSICPDLQRVGPSMMCNMLGERSRKSLQLVILRDLPHTYSCTCFYSKGKQRWKQQGPYRFWTTGSLNFIQIKSEKCLKHQILFLFFIIFFFCKDNPGYLPAVLGLWSQARPWGFILQLLMLMRFPTSSPFMDLSLFKLQG